MDNLERFITSHNGKAVRGIVGKIAEDHGLQLSTDDYEGFGRMIVGRHGSILQFRGKLLAIVGLVVDSQGLLCQRRNDTRDRPLISRDDARELDAQAVRRLSWAGCRMDRDLTDEFHGAVAIFNPDDTKQLDAVFEVIGPKRRATEAQTEALKLARQSRTLSKTPETPLQRADSIGPNFELQSG